MPLFAAVCVLSTGSFGYAASLDCTSGCVDQSFAGALFSTTEIQPAGTGIFNTFVQLQAQGRSTNEQGYNTTVNNVLDNKSSDQFNHEITIGQVPTKTLNSVVYREFSLDINESANTPLLSMDGLKIILSTTPNQSSTPLPTGTTIYDLDSLGDNWVKLNYNFISTGSGASDLNVYIPNSLFAGHADTTYVYLWSQFGLQTCCTADAGFEEWRVSPVSTVVPEPASVILLGSGFVGIGLWSMKRRKNA